MHADRIARQAACPGWWLPGPYIPATTIAARCPHFLVVAPPKTGSTWLAENLRAHPEVFVPAVKELKFFSSLFKCVDPGWYLEQFTNGEARLRGEASPSYSLLPVSRIQWIHQLVPHLKLIVLLREPVSRAWSHARHTHRYREATFVEHAPELATVTEAEWRASLQHDWLTASGDYFGQLRRWLSVFPREQVFVGFHESISTEPAALLRRVFTFLGVSADVNLASFPLRERILPGQTWEMPTTIREFLHCQWHARTLELTEFVKREFGLEPPPEWDDTLRPPRKPTTCMSPEDDAFLSRVLEHEEESPVTCTGVLGKYLGYDVVFARGRLVGVSRHLGKAELPDGVAGADDTTLRQLEEAGHCHFAPTLAEMKERIARHVLLRTEDHARALGAELGQACARVERLEAELAQAANRVNGLEAALIATMNSIKEMQADALRLTPREQAMVERFRRVIRWLARAIRRLRSLRLLHPFRRKRTTASAS